MLSHMACEETKTQTQKSLKVHTAREVVEVAFEQRVGRNQDSYCPIPEVTRRHVASHVTWTHCSCRNNLSHG